MMRLLPGFIRNLPLPVKVGGAAGLGYLAYRQATLTGADAGPLASVVGVGASGYAGVAAGVGAGALAVSAAADLGVFGRHGYGMLASDAASRAHPDPMASAGFMGGGTRNPTEFGPYDTHAQIDGVVRGLHDRVERARAQLAEATVVGEDARVRRHLPGVSEAEREALKVRGREAYRAGRAAQQELDVALPELRYAVRDAGRMGVTVVIDGQTMRANPSKPRDAAADLHTQRLLDDEARFQRERVADRNAARRGQRALARMTPAEDAAALTDAANAVPTRDYRVRAAASRLAAKAQHVAGNHAQAGYHERIVAVIEKHHPDARPETAAHDPSALDFPARIRAARAANEHANALSSAATNLFKSSGDTTKASKAALREAHDRALAAHTEAITTARAAMDTGLEMHHKRMAEAHRIQRGHY